METRVKPLLQQVAAQIADWFPDLEGRSVAVSDADIVPENVPTLPLVTVAFAGDRPEHSENTGNIIVNDAFFVMFWLKPERYKREDGSETPFWTFYDYESIRQVLLSNILSWVPEGSTRPIRYDGLSIETDQFAVVLSFQFTLSSRFCETEVEDAIDGKEIGDRLKYCLSPGDVLYDPACAASKQEKEEDPCHPSYT